jgi:hypothetical protein
MAIYTWSGGTVEITEARLIPVWVVKRPSRIDRYYAPPTKVPKGASVEEVPCWHYRGKYTDGHPLCDGKWVDAVGLRADDGWKEIQVKLNELCPDGEEKYRAWDEVGAPEASSFFPPITAKEAA